MPPLISNPQAIERQRELQEQMRISPALLQVLQTAAGLATPFGGTTAAADVLNQAVPQESSDLPPGVLQALSFIAPLIVRRGGSGKRPVDITEVSTAAERKRMRNTARAAGVFGGARAVTKTALARVDPTESVLDFGAGVAAKQTRILRDAGFERVTATDLPESIQAAPDVLTHVAPGTQFDTVLASNVLNIQPKLSILMATLEKLVSHIRPGGRAIVNYPKSPRYLDKTVDADGLKALLERFDVTVERVGGTKSEPVFEVRK